MLITPAQDKTINRQVQGKLAGRGLAAPCRINVQTLKGEVTLTGSVRYAQQKATAVLAARAVGGVRRVIDQLVVMAAVKR